MSISLKANADGSGTLLNGATPVMEVSAAGVVSLPNIAAGSSANQPVNFGQVIGVGQTWQNVTGNRVAGALYTNSTGKPIEVIVSAVNSASFSIRFVVNGVNLPYSGSSSSIAHEEYIAAIIPNGATYKLDTSGPIGEITWLELR